jgi:hypothetical protein
MSNIHPRIARIFAFAVGLAIGYWLVQLVCWLS